MTLHYKLLCCLLCKRVIRLFVQGTLSLTTLDLHYFDLQICFNHVQTILSKNTPNLNIHCARTVGLQFTTFRFSLGLVATSVGGLDLNQHIARNLPRLSHRTTNCATTHAYPFGVRIEVFTVPYAFVYTP